MKDLIKLILMVITIIALCAVVKQQNEYQKRLIQLETKIEVLQVQKNNVSKNSYYYE